MGEFADDANEEQSQSLEDLLAYESGQLSLEEAMERGIVDEHGAIPTQITTWGVHDVHTLLNELNRCELIIRGYEHRQQSPQKPVWVSNGKVCDIKKMTTQHLKNAIAFAKRKGMTNCAVEALKAELLTRSC